MRRLSRLKLALEHEIKGTCMAETLVDVYIVQSLYTYVYPF